MLASPVGERMPLKENIAMDTANGFGLRIVLKDQTREMEASDDCDSVKIKQTTVWIVS
jgi:hypothetical protein